MDYSYILGETSFLALRLLLSQVVSAVVHPGPPHQVRSLQTLRPSLRLFSAPDGAPRSVQLACSSLLSPVSFVGLPPCFFF